MKKNLIFYFSGTGNSLHIAKTIAESFENETELISMGKNDTYIFKEEDLYYNTIGFVFPIYAFGPPNKAYKFMKNLLFPKDKKIYYYIIPNYGFILGNGIKMTHKLLSDRIQVNYAYAIKTAHNCLEQKKETQQKLLEETEIHIKQIVEDIKNKKQITITKQFFLYTMIYNICMPKMKNKDKNFVIKNTCNACGICKNVCPVRNIKIEEHKPVFLHHCEQCMACIQFCPQRAINYKKEISQYNHPNISVNEIINYNSKEYKQ